MNNSLRRSAIEKFKMNPLAFVCLGVFFCIFASLCVALSLLVPFLGAIAIVLFAIPLLFGVIVQTMNVAFFEKVEFKFIVLLSFGYYNPQFAGSLRVLWTFLKSIIIELISFIIIILITGAVAHSLHPAEFDGAFALFRQEFLSGSMTGEELTSILDMNGRILLHVYNISICGSALVFYIAFIFQLFYNTLGIYFRSVLKPTALMLGKRSINSAIRANKGKILKDFLYLNWPLLVLGLLGACLGGYLSIVVSKDYIYIQDFGLIGALLLMAFYFPMYLANMNALYEKYHFIVILGVNNSIKETMEKIQKNIDLSEEDKEKIKETLDAYDREIKEMEEEEDENKKDSTE